MADAANVDASYFDQATSALAPLLNAYSSYEQQKTDRMKIDLQKSRDEQLAQLYGIDYDQQMTPAAVAARQQQMARDDSNRQMLTFGGLGLVVILGAVLLMK